MSFENVMSKCMDEENFIRIIDRVHTEVHRGWFFSNSNSTTCAANSTHYISIEPSGYYPNYQFEITTAAIATIDLYENATVASTWSATTSYNHNRMSTRTATTVIRNNVPSSDVTSTGTLIESYYIPGGTGLGNTKIGGDSANRTEWILKSSVKYVLKLTSASTNTLVYKSKWYEEQSPGDLPGGH